jgi:ABC-2 type transport system ATP-binding protein
VARLRGGKKRPPIDRCKAALSGSSKVDSAKAIQMFSLLKTFSTRSKSLQGTGTQRQLVKFLSLISGSGERDLIALDHVDLQIDAGEIFGLLGPNGAGKTTLIKILSTLILPNGGEAYVHGANVAKNPKAALKLIQTALANESGFEWRLTGRQNLEVFADLYEVPREEVRKRIDELLALTRIGEYADRAYNKYSTGTQKRLQVCRVLLSNAPVLVFDEPTSGLDAGAAVEFRKILKDVLVKQQGKTVIMASHNLWEVQQLCSHVAVLNRGKIIAKGTPSEVRGAATDRIGMSLVLGGDPAAPGSILLERIGKTEGIISTEMSERGANGYMTLRIEGRSDFDYSALFALLLSEGLKIRSIETSSPSLEDAFIKLTSEMNLQ